MDMGTVRAVGFVIQGTDCNDSDAAINPAASEVPADVLDQNCDGIEECYQDADQDGFGHLTTLVTSTNLRLRYG